MPEVVTGNRGEYEPQPGIVEVAGNVVVPIDPTHFATWIATLFDTNGILITPQGSLTIVDAAVGTALFKYSGCKIASLSMTFNKKGKCRATLGIIGCSMAKASTATPTACTVAPFLPHQIAFLEGGSALAGCTELTIEVNFGITPDDFIVTGPAYRKNLEEGTVSITGRLTLLLDSDALIVKSLANTATSLGVTIDNGTKTLTVSLPEVMFEYPTLDLPGPQGRLQQIPYKAFYGDDADASAIQISIADNA